MSRHPTRNNQKIPTGPPLLLSLSNLDRKILKYLFDNAQNQYFRFNIKEFARVNKIPRTNIYDSLLRLSRHEFVILSLGDKKISSKGRIYMETTVGRSVESSRSECRELKRNLSTHYHKFKLKIINPEKLDRAFIKTKLSSIKNNGIKENILPNLHQIIVSFEDAKIIINPKQVIISLFEVQTQNVEEADITCLPRMLNYSKILKDIGLDTEGAVLESGEWARIESQLSDWLYSNVDKKYYKKMSDGSNFWLDHSDGKSEDETDSKVFRENVDSFLDNVGTGKFSLQDINEAVSGVQELRKASSEAFREQNETIKDTQDILTKLSNQNMQITQVLEQVSNNQIRITKEISKNKS